MVMFTFGKQKGKVQFRGHGPALVNQAEFFFRRLNGFKKNLRRAKRTCC